MTKRVESTVFACFCLIAITMAGVGPRAQAGTTVLEQPGALLSDKHHAYLSGAIGETIQVPTNGDNILQSFGLYLLLPPNTIGNMGHLELYAWDGTKATGSALVDQVITVATDELNFQSDFVTLPGGGLALVPGAQYVMFFQASDDIGPAVFLSVVLGSVGYADGHAVRSMSNPADWTTTPWHADVDPPAGDTLFHTVFGPTVYDQIGFQATFVSAPGVPEPATVFAALLGVGVLVTFGRRRLA